MATASHFAAPRDGEASCRYAYGTTPLDPPGAHERGDGFAIRSPKDGEASLWSSMAPVRWASQEPAKVATVSQFAAPRDGEASFCLVCV